MNLNTIIGNKKNKYNNISLCFFNIYFMAIIFYFNVHYLFYNILYGNHMINY